MASFQLSSRWKVVCSHADTTAKGSLFLYLGGCFGGFGGGLLTNGVLFCFHSTFFYSFTSFWHFSFFVSKFETQYCRVCLLFFFSLPALLYFIYSFICRLSSHLPFFFFPANPFLFLFYFPFFYRRLSRNPRYEYSFHSSFVISTLAQIHLEKVRMHEFPSYALIVKQTGFPSLEEIRLLN